MQQTTDSNQSVRVRVPAKINLALCVGPVRPDGFHPLGTVFHAVSLFDEVLALPGDPGQVLLTMSGDGLEEVPADGSNLACRAARLLAERHGTPDLGVRLHLKKSIPVAGGMAGGSADCAGALLACSMLWDLDTTPDDLHDLAAELGSDAPFPLMGGNAIGTGRGDQLVPMISRGQYHWVLAFAHEGLSTPAVFRRFDELQALPGAPATGTEIPPEVSAALATGDAVRLGRALHNDLQAAAVDLRPELGQTLRAGLAAGALGGIVSGSGPTCAFLAASEPAAMDLSSVLAKLPTVRATRRATGPVPGATILG
ncbi:MULTISPECIES: 4-(cytidine 5'-diphospho)-2-C-methyl-D-erythritol kinase [unclassified Luteococcus]|uniref:4-(cytidine 5'-diphospho)-2-C-methyl-D-erythritol kinase n=1 Tax=unclassified Luteococcus TaxID=2639923 RepID=UPI00313BB51D